MTHLILTPDIVQKARFAGVLYLVIIVAGLGAGISAVFGTPTETVVAFVSQ